MTKLTLKRKPRPIAPTDDAQIQGSSLLEHAITTGERVLYCLYEAEETGQMYRVYVDVEPYDSH